MLTDTTDNLTMIRTENKTFDLVLVPRRSADKSPIHLLPGEYLFGSDSECEVILKSPGIAEKHCHIYSSPNQVVIKAIDRHTWINEGPFNESNLRPGDCLTIGPIEYRVESYSPEVHGISKEATKESTSSPDSKSTPHSPQDEETSALKEAINSSVVQGKLPTSAMELVDTAANQKAMDHALEEGIDPKFFRERLKKAIEATHLELQNHLETLGSLVGEEELTDEEKEVTLAAKAAVEKESQELIEEVESNAKSDIDTSDEEIEATSIQETGPISLSQSDWNQNESSTLETPTLGTSNEDVDQDTAGELARKEEELERDKRKLDARILDVDARWQTLIDREEKLQATENRHQEQVADFQKELADWKAEKETTNRSTDEKLFVLQSELTSLRKENETLQQNLSELAVLKSENQSNRTREKELLDRISQLENEESSLKSQISGIGNFQKETDEQTTNLQTTIDALRSENSELKQKCDILSKDLETLEANSRNAESFISHETDLNQRIQELEASESNLRDELEHAKSTLVKKDSQNQNAINEKLIQIESLRSDIDASNKLRAELEDKLQSISSDYNQLKDDFEIKVEQLNNQDGRLEQKISDLDQARAELDKEASGIRAELDEERQVLQDGRDELDRRVVDIEKLEKSLKQKSDELELKEAEYKNISKMRTELSESREQWENEKQSFDQKLQQFEQEKAEWESIRAEIENDRNEFQSLKDSIDSDREEIESRKLDIENEHQVLISRIEDYEKQIDQWNAKETEWVSKENDLKSLQDQLKLESESQQKQIEDLEKQILEIKKQEDEIHTLKASMQSDLDTHVETISRLENEITTLKETAADFDSRESTWKAREKELLELQAASESENNSDVDESLAEELRDREEALAKKESLLETKEKSLLERDTELNETEREIDNLKAELSSWKDDIAQREEDLDARNAELERQNQLLAEERLKWKVRRDDDEIGETKSELIEENSLENIPEENEDETLPTGSLLSSFLSASDEDEKGQTSSSIINEDSEKSSESEDTGELRNQLADLFGISEKAKLENEANQETIEDQIPDNSITSMLQSESMIDEKTDAASESISEDESESNKDSENDDDQNSPTAGGDDADDDPDSVASYMQKLLARSRGWQEPEEETKKQEPNKAVKAPEVKPVQVAPVPTETPIVKSESVEEKVDQTPISNEPRVRQNRDQVRENINSLREIANLSARSAVAKHSWKQMKTKVAFNSFLAVIAFTFATVCLISPLIWPGKNFLLYGILSILIGCVSCFELYRTNAQIQRQKSSGNPGFSDDEDQVTPEAGDAIPATN